MTCAAASASRLRSAATISMCSADRQVSTAADPNMPMMSEVRATSSLTIPWNTALPEASARAWWEFAREADGARAVPRHVRALLGRKIMVQTVEHGGLGAGGREPDDGVLGRAAGLEHVPRLGRGRARDEGAAIRLKLDDAAAGEHQKAAADAGTTDAERIAERSLGELGAGRQPPLHHRAVDPLHNRVLVGRRRSFCGGLRQGRGQERSPAWC